MEYTLFFDTNALLNLQEKAFGEHFIVSQKTLEEIENIKTSSRKDGEIKMKARKLARLLDKNNDYTVIPINTDIKQIVADFHLEETPDYLILASAYYQSRQIPILVVSDDINVKFISRNIFNLPTKGIDEIDLTSDEEYTGYREVTMSDEEMSTFYTNLNSNHYNLLVNQYLVVKNSKNEIVDKRRWDGETHAIVCDKTIKSKMFGDKIRPKDVYQACAIDSILSHTLTVLSGKAGSGKSLISLITMMSLLENGTYDRIVIMFNPTKTRGASDMGFYSGSAIEKAMQNSIGSILTSKFGDRFAVDLLLQQDKIRLVSMADVRGMEVRDNEILYITEAQNTSVDLIKLCLSRASSGCKIVIEGDYNSQVDSYLYDGYGNGMKRMIDALKGEPELGYVQLPNVWRSKIAALVEKL